MAIHIDKPIHADADNKQSAAKVPVESNKTLVLGLFFGILFGFLLQKGGVAKFHVLIGQLLLVDFTVVKVMLSAVVVGMLGIHLMHRLGMVELHIKPTRLASNTIGGLIFGCGFALSAYCPGTGAAALGQGNFDAIAMIVGMIAGSYLFAMASGWIARKINPVGDKGKLTLHEVLPINNTMVTIGCAILLSGVLVALETFTSR
ncbi:putative inner membrane protein [Polystyrenella longa]|uniref:Putative inner membrane protein n=1 Tax=Polystyrenella longa TaxID=2528007 RepID=A0A518CLH3_9PLAN|nr:DUF6691 family protein [Polystyrenella longa]QDU80072.1 putative inner membrane protein [Polystyrenella longa]